MGYRRRQANRSVLRRSRTADYLVAAGFLAVIALAAAYVGEGNLEEYSGRALLADGDTIVIAGERIRLEGIDTPEFGQKCRIASRSFDCGLAARDHLRKLIDRNTVICDGWLYDKYDRLLATCSARGIELNRRMVKDGWAVAFGAFEAEEAEAKKNKRGIWQGEFMRPREWRIEHGSMAGEDFEDQVGIFRRAFARMSNFVFGWLN